MVLDEGEKYARYLPYGVYERLICLCVDHSASYTEQMLPVIQDERAVIALGPNAVVKLSLARNYDDKKIWIKVATRTKTSFEDAQYAVGIIYSMISSLESDFFSKSRGMSVIPVSLLLPSTQETNFTLAEYSMLNELGKTKSSGKFFPKPSSSETAMLEDFAQWLAKADLKNPAAEFEQEFEKDQTLSKVSAPADATHTVPPGLKYHCFLSYKQSDAIHLVGKQYFILTSLGYKCWFDQQLETQITLEAMQQGVEDSMCYVLFLTKNVFESHFVGEEVKRALEKKKPIIFLHHPDTDKDGYCSFSHYIETAPEHVKPLFSKIESIRLQTRYFLEEAVTRQIDERLSKMLK